MEKVTIFEMGPRDGLQNEPGTINTADKSRWLICYLLQDFKKLK